MNYTHGGDIYRNKIQYDFSVNINPLGMPAEAYNAVLEACEGLDRYPDFLGATLRDKIAQAKGIKNETILLGNGAAELIYLLCAYLSVKTKRGLRAYMPAPTFSEYEAAIKAYGGTVDYFRLQAADSFDISEAFIDGITEAYDIVFVCNPNNPTGRLADKSLLQRIADKCKRCNVILMIDEAFMPFVEKENSYSMLCRDELEAYPNMLVFRAFTKIYAMPGLRLGYAVCSDEQIIQGMKKMTQPWNTSIPAQMAGIYAIDSKEYIERTRKLIASERLFLESKLRNGLAENIIESAANFILLRAEKDLYDKMLKHGIMIRKCNTFEGLADDYFRIAVRTHEENELLIKTWRSEVIYKAGK